MALTYIGANGIFTQIGKSIKVANTYLTLAATLATDLSDQRTILNAGNAGNRDALIAALTNAYGDIEGSGGYKSQVSRDWRGFLSSIVDRRLQDYDTVISQLGITDNSIPTILSRLIDEMTIDAASLNASVGGLGAVSAASGNVGNGTALTSLVLDGATPPGQSMMSHQRYRGINSELIAADTMTLLCVADSQGSGGGGRTSEGAEVFRWYGPQSYPPLSWEDESSGEGPSIVVTNAPSNSLLKNKDFEYFTANIPNGWTRDLGTAGTHIVEESTAADVYRGSKALRFDGDGALAAIQLSQIIPLNRLVARKRYCLSLRYKASATIAAGQFTVQFEGTGYTAGATEKIDIAAGSLATTYTLSNFFVNMPASIPTDGTFKLVIKWTGTPTAAKKLWIDSLTISEPAWHNGHAAVVVAGSTPWKFGDRLTYAATNTEGVIQKWFRLTHGVQLPSDNAAAETIVDTLAT